MTYNWERDLYEGRQLLRDEQFRRQVVPHRRLGYALPRPLNFHWVFERLAFVLDGIQDQHGLAEAFLVVSGLCERETPDDLMEVVEKPTDIHARKLALRILKGSAPRSGIQRRVQATLVIQAQLDEPTEFRMLATLAGRDITPREFHELLKHAKFR